MIQEIRPVEAWRKLRDEPGTVLLDVRSTMEYLYVGHPLGALSVPWQEPPAWEVDPAFASRVEEVLKGRFPEAEEVRDLAILSLCRSGARSEAAGLALLERGFRRVFNVIEGFEGERDGEGHRNTLNGWRFHGLPWEQS